MEGTGKEKRVETSERGSKVCDGPAIHRTRPSIGLVESTVRSFQVETKGCVPCRRSFVSNRDPRPWAGFLGPNKLSRSVGLWVGPKDWPIEPRSESCDLSKIVGLGFDLFWAWPNDLRLIVEKPRNHENSISEWLSGVLIDHVRNELIIAYRAH
ncbi:hypothetical protein F2Q70_00036433 [Brassica cretica]|uniref:Uncharacterized protein n=1 Tax=Brassica cretica TaxID=69181 RepID=A0A8S9JZI9_BRACR|nr:hypothetical protein F2Q70_00036433 [Brassica cretica]